MSKKTQCFIMLVLFLPWLVGFTLFGRKLIESQGLIISLADLADGDSVYCTGVDDFIAGEEITIVTLPHPVYMRPDGDDGSTYFGGRILYFDADALATDKNTYPMLGFAITSATAGDPITVDFGGLVKITRDDGHLWTANEHEGQAGYASILGGGAVSMTKPSDPGDDLQRVLIVLRVNDAAGDGPGGVDQGDGNIFMHVRQNVSATVRPTE